MAFKSFYRDKRGNIGLMFAFLLVPLLGFVGVAIDYQRATIVQSRLQQTLDTISLRLANEGAGLDGEQLLARAQELIDSVYQGSGTDYQIVVTSATRANGEMEIVAEGVVPTTFTQLLGFETLDVGVRSQAAWGSGILEIALVLDNTTSMGMGTGKMEAVKEAVNALLDELVDANSGEEDFVHVSVIPFTTEINIGTGYEDEEWLLIPPDEAMPNDCNWWCQWLWEYYGGGDTFDWEGCVIDRGPDSSPPAAWINGGYPNGDPNPAAYNTNDAPYNAANENTGYEPVEDCYDTDLARLMPLTADFDAIRDRVDDMEPAGYTNITLGMAWGLASLSDHAPLTQGQPYGTEDLTKIMILLTDGDNTMDRWTNTDGSVPASSYEEGLMDPRTAAVCEQVKAQGIILYTVRVIDGNAGLLEACATEDKFFYDISVVDDLVPAFTAIGQGISQLRLAG